MTRKKGQDLKNIMAIHKFCSTASIAAFMLFLRTAFSGISIAPSSSEVQRGGSTYFNCSTSVTSKEVHWFHYPVSSTERTFVYGFGEFYNPYLGRFAIDKNVTTGEYNLVITSVVAEDAGKYECQDDAGSGMKKSAHLIILETDLTCLSNVNVQKVIGPNSCGIEPDQLILTCMAQYHGNEAPILQWELNVTNKPITNGVTRETNGNLVMYNLTRATDELLDGSFYACRTTRSTTKISCHSGNVQVVGSLAYYSASVPSEVCKPYIKPYSDAIICIIMIVLPVAIAGTVFVLWYLLAYRPKKRKQADNLLLKDEIPCEVRITEEMNSLKTSESLKRSAIDTNGEEDEDETSEFFCYTRPQEDRNNDPDVIIKELEKRLRNSEDRVKRRDKAMKISQKKIDSIQMEKDEMQAKVKDLEQLLYPKEHIDYFGKPVLAHTIALSEKNKGKSVKNSVKSEKSKGKSISGIAVLGKELFVVAKCSHEMKVYDSNTFQIEREMKIGKMSDPLDVASSKDANCLYVVDQSSKETASIILKLDHKGNVLNQWSTGGGKGRLSTYRSNVILCLSDKNLINEYSSDGTLVATVRLSPAAQLNNPLHAIKVSSAHFVVSHGDFKDELHRMCVVDLDGNIKKECTKLDKSSVGSPARMKVPICLVEDDEKSIIVADCDNNRILMLSSMWTYQRKFVEKENGLKDFPVRLCFDDTQSRLFVAVNKKGSGKEEWDGGRILIFNIK